MAIAYATILLFPSSVLTASGSKGLLSATEILNSNFKTMNFNSSFFIQHLTFRSTPKVPTNIRIKSVASTGNSDIRDLIINKITTSLQQEFLR
jgi:hypothetical protein